MQLQISTNFQSSLMELNWSTGGTSSEAGGSSSSTHNSSSSTPYTHADSSSLLPYAGYPPYSYSPPTSDFAPYHRTFGIALYHSSSWYAIDYSSFAPYTHAAYASVSGTGRHSISFPPQYSSYSQLLMSTSSMHAQFLTLFFYWNTRTTRTQPALHGTIVLETQQPTSTTTKGRAKSSKVWKHFEEKTIDDGREAECRYRHELFNHKERYGTSVLSKHYDKLKSRFTTTTSINISRFGHTPLGDISLK